MSGAGLARRRCASPALGSGALGTVTAYAAAIAAFAYALVSLYWAVGGRGLVSTVGGYVEQFAHRGGAVPVLVALAATAAKVAGGLLALALVRPWGRAIRLGWLRAGAAAASVLLVLYGAVNVAAGALVSPVPSTRRAVWTAPRCADTSGSGTCGSWCGASCWRWLPRATGFGPATGTADRRASGLVCCRQARRYRSRRCRASAGQSCRRAAHPARQ